LTVITLQKPCEHIDLVGTIKRKLRLPRRSDGSGRYVNHIQTDHDKPLPPGRGSTGENTPASTPASSPKFSFSRINRLPPYVFNITAELKMAARRRGEDIIDMSMGNPDGATPKHIVDKLVEVAQRPDTHGYSASKGIPRLRRAIARWYKDRYAVDLNPDSEAIVTIGSKEGLAHLMLATLDKGDTVLVPNPSYPIHIYGAVIAGADIRSIRMSPDVDFFSELERAIRETYPKPKMMIFGFPSNPTAQCVELEFFERVVKLAKEHNILVVHDLAYADIVYDGWKAPSIMQVPGARDVAVEFFTLSKSYNMAGWRIGFMVGNKELVAALARIKSYHDYGSLRRCRWRQSPHSKAIRPVCTKFAISIRIAAMCWSKACTTSAGWSISRKHRCISGRIFLNITAILAHSNSRDKCWIKPNSASRQASVSVNTVTTTCVLR
jgi:histidinol-phosphate/aromatic aminotransferase/cobyric acid decarboxylase-like protein